MNDKNLSNTICVNDSVNIIEIEDTNEKGKVKGIFRCGNYTIELFFDYEDMVAIGTDRDALKKLIPYHTIFNHIFETINENESEEN